jgi:hypothetical protein
MPKYYCILEHKQKQTNKQTNKQQVFALRLWAYILLPRKGKHVVKHLTERNFVYKLWTRGAVYLHHVIMCRLIPGSAVSK